ncbi:MAG: insulinase family protein [Oscillospiraceae bacterium]|nr:insulinase family protein [Oscillospiraceae bacterium]
MKSKIYERIGEQLYHERLANGLQIYVVKKPDFRKSMAFFTTRYGGADTRYIIGSELRDTPAGIAHFLEHKTFEMKEGDALTSFSKNGASANAFTSADMTAYFFECTDHLSENLELLLSFVSKPYFTEESVARERGIIGQEIKMTEDSPDFVIYHNLLNCLYKDNPIKNAVAGTVESIGEITADTLYKCHKVFYHPSNMALCVIGNIEPDAVAEMAERVLTKTVSVSPERDYGASETRSPVSKYIEAEMEVGLPMFLIGVKVPSVKRGDELLKQSVTAELALEYLAGQSSPLYARLYADGDINGEFSTDFEVTAGASMALIGGESRDPELVKAKLKKEIRRILSEGVDDALFGRLKKAAVGDELRGLNSFDNMCYNITRGGFFGYDALRAVEMTLAVTPEDIAEFIRENLKPDNFAMSVVRSPEKGQVV